jgi:protein-serine/threonine kinase
MLAGYLPFDDDPANPEGDNINLLYKYIISTPLTFPEYVSPHSRDLLKRMLVPDPCHRADLFEVARHTWMQPYINAVAHFTSLNADTRPGSSFPVTPGKIMYSLDKIFFQLIPLQKKLPHLPWHVAHLLESPPSQQQQV